MGGGTTGLTETSARRTVVRSGMSALAIRVGGRLVAYVFALVVAQLAGPETWGRFSLSLAVISIGGIVAVTGFDTALVKLAAAGGRASTRAFRQATTLTIVQGVAVGIAVWTLAPALATSVFGEPELTRPFRWAALAVAPVALLNLGSRTLSGFSKIAASVLYHQVWRLGIPLGLFLGMVGTAITFGGATSDLVVAYAVGNLVLLLPLARSVRRASRNATSHPEAVPASLSGLYSLSLPLFLAASMGFLKGWADTILVGVYLDATQVGIYDIAFRLGSAISLPLWGASAIGGPLIAVAAERGDWGRVEEVARTSAALAFALALPVAAALVVAPAVFLGLFGKGFVVGASALRWIALGYLFNTWAGLSGVVMTMGGLHKGYQHIVLVSTALSIGLNVVLLPTLGIDGAALSSFLGLIAFNGIAVLAVRNCLGVGVVCRWSDLTEFLSGAWRDTIRRLNWNR